MILFWKTPQQIFVSHLLKAYSFFANEQELIYSLLKIHNNGNPIELDPMFNKGMFYNKDKGLFNKLELPKYRFDLNATKMGYDAQDGDATNLPLESNSIQCVMLDPHLCLAHMGRQKTTL